MLRAAIVAGLVVAVLAAVGQAADASEVPDSTILMVSPHPDDDVLVAAGVTSVSSDVTVAYLTNGEFCEKLVTEPGKSNVDYCGVAVPTIGTIRQNEAVAAQVNLLNRTESDLIFFGYPTVYLEETSYYAADEFFTSPTGRFETFASRGLGSTDYHTYRTGSAAKYNGPNMLADMVHLIDTLRPDDIFTTSIFDRHTDHKMAYILTVDAVEQVAASDPTYNPTLHSTIVHVIPSAYWGIWPDSADPTAYLTPIPELELTTGGTLRWEERESFEVPASMQNANLSQNVKFQAIEAHASQHDPNLQDAGFIYSFAHRDEVFWSETLPNSNNPATGVTDHYADLVKEGESATVPAIGVLGNDIAGHHGEEMTASFVSNPSNGSLSLRSDGSFTYTHNGSDTTTDSFQYRPVQGSVAGSIATVTITITPTGGPIDPPVAVNDGIFNVAYGMTLPKSAPGVLGNDSDPRGGGLSAVKSSDPSHGTVTLNSDGSFVYVHDGVSGTTDSFTYRAKDSGGVFSNVAAVSIKIGSKPPPPTVEGHTTGLVDPTSGKWYLYDGTGALITSFLFGNPGDYPFMGDWDGDGVETPGLYRQSDGFVYLRNSNTTGIAHTRFYFGNPGDVPIAGDFNNNGFDTVSIYRPSNQTFYIINALGSDDKGLGAADTTYVFGNPGDKPFVGDFDGDGIETVGLHRESSGLVYFRNTHSQGTADNQFIFGNPGDRLIAGDWTSDGIFTPALFRPAGTTMFFRHTNSPGNADDQYNPQPSSSNWLPVAGKTH
jgi:LmbE family N-acetylglucosaminyl deacetylase